LCLASDRAKPGAPCKGGALGSVSEANFVN
jgi:hypothetical protein